MITIAAPSRHVKAMKVGHVLSLRRTEVRTVPNQLYAVHRAEVLINQPMATAE